MSQKVAQLQPEISDLDQLELRMRGEKILSEWQQQKKIFQAPQLTDIVAFLKSLDPRGDFFSYLNLALAFQQAFLEYELLAEKKKTFTLNEILRWRRGGHIEAALLFSQLLVLAFPQMDFEILMMQNNYFLACSPNYGEWLLIEPVTGKTLTLFSADFASSLKKAGYGDIEKRKKCGLSQIFDI